ncbi:NAD(P)/FAD-dependent oxidoreductase [Candidatus Xianfuyuplasma coldseepsis]|uniref:FAD-dependent oxidoreductase n=1 Tax=Candidatus Xianfuyuplasma coldseepsis TaxID=2782163 RepID=A0A7L7KS03_9MOLU|nr:NAD(P)/FAD-dependent oxidoreductase [Xianfuyuplasma coldseepsis]QMS85497.1 FAD-dependent oxidoreductase [Xianfuyuplasma coldseepsis]
MNMYDLVIIGGGPAGLSAAKTAAEAGVKALIVERDYKIGGQLVKQTHMFFGSEKQYAKTRGIDIAQILIDDVMKYPDQIEIMTEATVVGLYPDYVVTIVQHDVYTKVQAKAILVATGASEKFLAFENNDLPGIYGAGAVQTLMNVHGVLPGQSVIMVGSGNIGLIVSYQLIQAGVNVLMVIEAAPTIGGYKVHASKLKRLGVDIKTNTTIQRAIGRESLEQIEIVEVDEHWNPIAGTEEVHDVDALCISVGLSPLSNLLSMIDADMKYVGLLGGWVAVIDEFHETSVKNVFVAGDVCGVEEASSAIVEGYYTGLIIAKRLGFQHPEFDTLKADYKAQLDNLRSGPFGEKTRRGLEELRGEQVAK